MDSMDLPPSPPVSPASFLQGQEELFIIFLHVLQGTLC